MADLREPTCRHEYEPANRQRGDRIVRCGLPKHGRDVDHEEADTEITWPWPPLDLSVTIRVAIEYPGADGGRNLAESRRHLTAEEIAAQPLSIEYHLRDCASSVLERYQERTRGE